MNMRARKARPPLPCSAANPNGAPFTSSEYLLRVSRPNSSRSSRRCTIISSLDRWTIASISVMGRAWHSWWGRAPAKSPLFLRRLTHSGPEATPAGGPEAFRFVPRMANSRVNGATGFEFEKHFQVQRAGCMLLGLGFVLGCAPQPLSDGERRVALAMATEQVILPTYAELSDRTAELSSLLDELA